MNNVVKGCREIIVDLCLQDKKNMTEQTEKLSILLVRKKSQYLSVRFVYSFKESIFFYFISAADGLDVNFLSLHYYY